MEYTQTNTHDILYFEADKYTILQWMRMEKYVFVNALNDSAWYSSGQKPNGLREPFVILYALSYILQMYKKSLILK